MTHTAHNITTLHAYICDLAHTWAPLDRFVDTVEIDHDLVIPLLRETYEKVRAAHPTYADHLRHLTNQLRWRMNGRDWSNTSYEKYSADYDFVRYGWIYDRADITGKSRPELRQFYKQTHLAALPPKTQSVIQKLTQQLETQHNTRCQTSPIIVMVPVYIDEDIQSLLDVLATQTWSWTTVLYLNAYRHSSVSPRTEWKRPSASSRAKCNGVERSLEYPSNTTTWHNWNDVLSTSDEVFITKRDEVTKLIQNYPNTILLDHLYDTKTLMGSFVADMTDAVVTTYPWPTEPIMMRCDADTWHIEDGYIASLEPFFASHPDISYMTGQVRYTQPHRDRFYRLGETLAELAWYRNQRDLPYVPTYGGSMVYRASDRIRIKGTQRDISRMEDYVIARKIAQRYGSATAPDRSKGMRYDKMIFCSPRRQIQNMLAWRYRHENTDEFSFVDMATLETDRFAYEHDIISRLITAQNVLWAERAIIEEYIATFCQTRRDVSQTFASFRNENMSQYSLYQIVVPKEGRVRFLERVVWGEKT